MKFSYILPIFLKNPSKDKLKNSEIYYFDT